MTEKMSSTSFPKALGVMSKVSLWSTLCVLQFSADCLTLLLMWYLWWACGLCVLYSCADVSSQEFARSSYANVAFCVAVCFSQARRSIYIKISSDFKEQWFSNCLYRWAFEKAFVFICKIQLICGWKSCCKSLCVFVKVHIGLEASKMRVFR